MGFHTPFCLLIGVALLPPLGVESFISTASIPWTGYSNIEAFGASIASSSSTSTTTRSYSPGGKAFSITFEDYEYREMRYKVEQDLRDENNKLLAGVVSDIKRHVFIR